MLAAPYLSFVHPDDRAATVAEAQKLSAGGDTIWIESAPGAGATFHFSIAKPRPPTLPVIGPQL